MEMYISANHVRSIHDKLFLQYVSYNLQITHAWVELYKASRVFSES